MKPRAKKWILIASAGFLLAASIALASWYMLWREVPQPAWIASDQRSSFLYGSLGLEQTAGIPYWVWLELPRLFPEHMPGVGGYVSVGMSWEEGKEMPAGFSKKIVGYVRVAGNCAVCHARSYRKGPDEGAVVVPVVPGRATDLGALFLFVSQCAQDPRFNADEILADVDTWTSLSFTEHLLYRLVLIPRAQRTLLDPRSIFTGAALQQHSLDPKSDAPFTGETTKALRTWMRTQTVPPYPLPVNETLAAGGKRLFAEHCASCHVTDAGKPGAEKIIPIADVATDSRALRAAGGYVAPSLQGTWVRGPYLHNGSVPTVRDLLNPPARRPGTFYQGSNLLDPHSVGFDSTSPEEKGLHYRVYDTTRPGNSNSGHLYGTDLTDAEKEALLEYVKTL